MTTWTQLDGRYSFTDPLPGRYFMTFAGLPSFVPTSCNQGSDELRDSDACRVDLTNVAQTAPFTVTTQQVQPNWDAGFTLPATIRGRAYLDLNRNNQPDPAEPPVVDVTIILQEGNIVVQSGRTFLQRRKMFMVLNRNNQELARTVTGADGSYIFTNLTPGRYQLSIILPVGFTAPSPTIILPWLTSGEQLREDAGLVAIQPTNLTEAPEPTRRLYLPLIQTQ